MPTIKMSPKDIADKHIRRTSAASADMAAGVKAVTEAPSKAAIAAKQKLVQNWTAAVNDGRWERGLAKVDLTAWQNAMINKGVGRVAAGLEEARTKLEDFYSELVPFQNDLLSKVDKLPSLTLEDSITRATTWMRGMAEFRKRRGTR